MRIHYGDDQPIAAFATTPGNSALTLIRCSGKGSIEMAAGIFTPEKIKNAAGNSVVHGWIVSPNDKTGGLIDEVLVAVFRSPKSYTGEDSLDISCHGGLAAGRAVMEALKSAGFRDALPGEFSFRAFMNGKLDLTRCESVMELVSAKTETGRSHAVIRLSGSLEAEVNKIKKQLVEVLSGAEIFLDYSEDEIEEEPEQTAEKLPKQDIALEALARLKRLLFSWQHERIYQEGLTAVIAGPPNAGKSTLFNLLLKEERSIVTPIPGTTRDWIEAWISIGGIPVRLIDTAGLRESADPVERAGVERSRKLLQEAHIVLYLIDGEQGVTAEDRDFIVENAERSKQLLVVWNKADLAPPPGAFPFAADKPISFSGKTEEGLAELNAAIASALQADESVGTENGPQSAALGSQRQKRAAGTACAALEEALALAGKEEPLDLIAPLLREAVNALGEITGEVSTADILDEIFSNFCVGK